MRAWDDIIPLEDHQKFKEEEQERERQDHEAQVAKDSAGRKRAAAMVQPGAYEGMDGVDMAPPAPATKKAKNPASMRKTAAQRAIELKEHDLRVLVRSLQHWGDIRLRYNEIVCIMFRITSLWTTHLVYFEQCKEAKLEHKNRSIILEMCDDIIETCEEALRLRHEPELLMKVPLAPSPRPCWFRSAM